MKTRNLFIVLLVLMFNMSCEEDSGNNGGYADNVDTGLHLSFIGNDGVDLLASDNNEAYTNIEVYQLDGDTKKRINYILADPSLTKHSYYYLGFSIENENAYFLKLNEEETDTIYGVVEKFETEKYYNLILTKIIYNGLEMIKDSTGIHKIYKD